MNRRRFLHLSAGAALLPSVPRPAIAQAYPSRQIRIIVGFTAGGNFDIVARLIGQWLSDQLGQPVVVENRPGAGSNLATEAVDPRARRRLHAAARRRGERGQCDALRQARVQLHRRHHAGDRRRPVSQCHDGQSVVSGEDDRRLHRLRESKPGQDQSRLIGQRDDAASGRRAVQDDDGRQLRARALSRSAAGADRPASAGRCRCCSSPSRRRSSTSGRARYAPWR